MTTNANPWRQLGVEVLKALRVLIVAGIPVGVLVGGVGSRLFMLLLRVTSGDQVDGLTSDDGFEIGRFTASGTYNLLALGAAIGIIGAAAYQWVRPWLLGPPWFRYLTVAAASGAVVGALLVHADGVDFTALTPTWLAVGTFVVLPAIFGAVIGPAVEIVERRAERDRQTKGAWIVPVVLVIAFPPTILLLAFAVVVLTVWVAIRDEPAVRRVSGASRTRIAARAAWLALAAVGLVVLVGDIVDVYAVT